MRALQHLLTHSCSGKVLAVRRVTENNGKKTPGVDRKIWDTPEKKTQAVHALKRRGYQSQPLRRVYIPKSDGKTMRPLGIPTMKDRAQQALYLLALAPVVETIADRNSYGFRQQRSCADAMEQCFKALRSANTQWILEGDIKSCFDKISHDWLLAHVRMDRVILQKWLKAGYMENMSFTIRWTGPHKVELSLLRSLTVRWTDLNDSCRKDIQQENGSSLLEVRNPVSISSVMRMTSSSPVNRRNYWKEKSSPWSSAFCKNEVLNSLRRRRS